MKPTRLNLVALAFCLFAAGINFKAIDAGFSSAHDWFQTAAWVWPMFLCNAALAAFHLWIIAKHGLEPRRKPGKVTLRIKNESIDLPGNRQEAEAFVKAYMRVVEHDVGYRKQECE